MNLIITENRYNLKENPFSSPQMTPNFSLRCVSQYLYLGWVQDTYLNVKIFQSSTRLCNKNNICQCKHTHNIYQRRRSYKREVDVGNSHTCIDSTNDNREEKDFSFSSFFFFLYFYFFHIWFLQEWIWAQGLVKQVGILLPIWIFALKETYTSSSAPGKLLP